MKLAGDIVRLFNDAGKADEIKETLSRLVNQHQASSRVDALVGKSRSDTYADILGPEVFER